MNLFNYKRRDAVEVVAGDVRIGGNNPVRVQSMTTTDTTDTEGSVAQAERIADAGGELVRLTTQGVREAENLRSIVARLRADGYTTPIVADVHFNPRVADVAALYADKVRINPGNYVDPARTFKHLQYSDEEYSAELKRIEQRLVPFLNICKEHGTAIRIGVNHGSLSDRIMSRYGDTPEGIVESCMEFLRICAKEHFDNVVISIKASNTVVMVRSVRLLTARMDKEGMRYPLHLGVTEAGEGEDGRLKSAVGIGALLADGIGDTVRVSLSEEPEAEIPVAKQLVDYVSRRAGHAKINGRQAPTFDYLRPERRVTRAVRNIGGANVPVVIMTGRSETHGESDTLKADYIYIGAEKSADMSTERQYIIDYKTYTPQANVHPLFRKNEIAEVEKCDARLKFLYLNAADPPENYEKCLREHPEVVVICRSDHVNRVGEMRAFAHGMMCRGLTNPIVFCMKYNCPTTEHDRLRIEAAADMGALMIDGLTDGLWLCNEDEDVTSAKASDYALLLSTAYGILQAARLRTTKTEYISCPGCGRTLYDLRSTIARIKEATSGMTGLKIGIMGCIVNGPGEMADADYGYVGAGRGKISLYRRKECVAKNIPEAEAVERLLRLINSDKNLKERKKEE